MGLIDFVNSTDNRKPALILGLSLAFGIVISSLLLARALESKKNFERYVTVKGLAEREVAADLAIWPITFKVAENDLKKLQEILQANRVVVHTFLTSSGFE